MLEVLLIGVVAGMVVASAIVFFAIHRYQGRLQRIALRQEGWERAQEARQQQWQLQQERKANELEKKVTVQVQEVKQSWQQWTEQDATRARLMEQQYQSITLRGSIEYELAHLPRTDDAALPLANEAHDQMRYAQAARLGNADLTGRDLSRRYLRNADIRGACLVKANLYMADLSNASLVGADLSGADLAGANLSGADLRDAILSGANVLVADMNGAILTGANLKNARNLTMEQLNSAIYDRTTLHDVEPDATLPRIPRIVEYEVQTPDIQTQYTTMPRPTRLEALPETPKPLPLMPFIPHEESDITIPIPQQNGRKHVKAG